MISGDADSSLDSLLFFDSSDFSLLRYFLLPLLFSPPLCFPPVFSLPIQNTQKNQNPEWYIDGNWRKKKEKRMVIHTSPIDVDSYRDKVVAVDFWFFLFVQVCVGYFSYICLNWFKTIKFEEATHSIIIKWRDTKIDLTNNVTLKFNGRTILQYLCKR